MNKPEIIPGARRLTRLLVKGEGIEALEKAKAKASSVPGKDRSEMKRSERRARKHNDEKAQRRRRRHKAAKQSRRKNAKIQRNRKKGKKGR